MSSSFDLSCDTSSVQESLRAVVRGVNEHCIRPAAQAAAQVFVDEARARAPVADAPTVTRDGKVIQPGLLRDSIYQAFATHESSPTTAVYHISWRGTRRGGGGALASAPHGHLLEFGHWRYFALVRSKDGRWRTMVHPSKIGTPRPDRRASLAVKSQYYVALPTPVWVAPKPFLAPAYEAKKAAAKQAAEQVFAREFANLKVSA